MTFTPNELLILESTYRSMKANGFDFGITEEIIPGSGLPTKTGVGVLREVRKKLRLTFDNDKVNGYRQFYLGREIGYKTTFEEWLEIVGQ